MRGGLHFRDQAVELPPEVRHALDRDAEAPGEQVEAAAHRGFDGLRTLRRHPDRRVRLLQGLRKDRRLWNLEELAVVGERLAVERLEDDVDGLFPARPGAVELQPEPLELVVLVAAPEPDIDAPARQLVQRGNLLRDDERMVQRHDDDGGARRAAAWSSRRDTWRAAPDARGSRTSRSDARRATRCRSRASRPPARCRRHARRSPATSAWTATASGGRCRN